MQAFFQRFFTSVFAVVLLLSPVHTFAYTSPGIPEGYVNDFAHVLTANEEASLEALVQDYEQRTSHEIALVTIPTTGDETIETYAVKLFEEWGIGKKGKDTGVLVLAAIQDRKIRIEVGYGLEPLLTDAASALIIQQAVPLFQEQRYDDALNQIELEIESVLSGYESTERTASSGPPSAFEVWTDQFISRLPPGVGALLLIVFFFFVIAFGRFLLGFILALFAYSAVYIFSVLTGQPKPLFKQFFSGAASGFFAGILSGMFRGGGGFGGGSSSGGFGGGRSGGGGASGSW